MPRSIVFAASLALALAACARNTVPPPPNTATAFTAGFAPYCGPVWSVDRQGYVDSPCPAGSSFRPQR